jgi:hypothetical protein
LVGQLSAGGVTVQPAGWVRGRFQQTAQPPEAGSELAHHILSVRCSPESAQSQGWEIDCLLVGCYGLDGPSQTHLEIDRTAVSVGGTFKRRLGHQVPCPHQRGCCDRSEGAVSPAVSHHMMPSTA